MMRPKSMPARRTWRGPLAAILVLFAVPLFAPAVQLGDTMEDVRNELGRPTGTMKVGNTEILTYDRGEVELVDGKVVSADLISADQAKAENERRQAEEQARREREQARREELRVEGLEVYERKVNDQAFMNAPASERVAFWKRFKKQYPDVPLGDEYAQAQREYEMEVAAQGAAAADARRAAEMQRQAQVQAESTQYRGPSYANDSYWYQSPAVIVSTDARYDRRDRGYQSGVTYKEFHSTPGFAYQHERPDPSPSTRPRPTPLPARPVTRPQPRINR